MELKELLNYAQPCDVPEAYQPVVSLIGVEAFLKLCSYARGQQLYFPVESTIIRNVRDHIIDTEYTGTNVTELAAKYNLTTRQIYLITAANKKNHPID